MALHSHNVTLKPKCACPPTHTSHTPAYNTKHGREAHSSHPKPHKLAHSQLHRTLLRLQRTHIGHFSTILTIIRLPASVRNVQTHMPEHGKNCKIECTLRKPLRILLHYEIMLTSVTLKTADRCRQECISSAEACESFVYKHTGSRRRQS